MKILATAFDGLYEIHLERMGDERGWFMRTFDDMLVRNTIKGYTGSWVQMNHSYNSQRYTWRGFHFQKAPHQETKTVRCISGSVLDCVLDLREDSNTYLQVFSTELTKENSKMLYIPKGCAHGFLTLEDDTELVYMHDAYYHSDYEQGVRYDDPYIHFKLPFAPEVISDRDKNHKLLNSEM